MRLSGFSARRRVAATCAVALCALVGGSVAATESSATAPTTVKFGVIYTTGSPVEDTGDLYGADLAAVRAINAAGGLAGKYRISLVGCDDQGNTNQIATCARQLVSAHVVALMGAASLDGTTLNQILAAANIPEIGITPQAGPEFNAKNVFLFSGGGEYAWLALGAWAAHNKVPTSVVTSATPSGEAFEASVAAAFKQAGGTFTNVVPVPATQADYAPIVLSAASSGAADADVILGRQSTEAFAAANQQSGGTVKKILTAWSFSTADSSAIGGVKGLETMLEGSPFVPWTTSKLPLMVAFRKQLAAEHASGDGYAQLSVVDDSGFQGWLAFQALNILAKDGKLTQANLTATGITKVLNTTKKLNLGGVMPPWTPSAPGPTGLVRVDNTANYFIGFNSKGAAVLLTPKALTIPQIEAGAGPKA